MKIDLSKVNLNLLVALHALLNEQHVTKAAKQLQITQPAMSNLLKQLREIFKDELFIRGQSSLLIPTPYAIKLLPRVTAAIEKISQVFNVTDTFNPAQAKNTFIIGLSDYTEFLLLPDLIKAITTHAPHIRLVVKHLNNLSDKTIFEKEELDLAICLEMKIPNNLISQHLFTDKVVCVGDKKNPHLKKPITSEVFAKAKHLLILYYENKEELLGEPFLKELGLERDIIVTVPRTLTAIYSLANTEFISFISEYIAKRMIKHLPLAYQKVAFTPGILKTQMIWHPQNRNDAAHKWLRETVIKTAKKLQKNCMA